MPAFFLAGQVLQTKQLPNVPEQMIETPLYKCPLYILLSTDNGTVLPF
jgi:hypothetical protein